MSKDVKDTEAQEELKDKVNAGDVKEEKETKEKHAKAKKERRRTNSGKNPACYGQFRKSSEKYGNGRRCAGFTRRS